MLSRDEFATLVSQGYNRIPICYEFLGDLETPLSIYLKVAHSANTYLLESVQNGEKWGQYSFIGLPCDTVIQIKNNHLSIKENENITTIALDDPLQWIQNYFDSFSIPPILQLPRFTGGLVGYFGYDTIRYIEPRLRSCQNPDDLHVPDILLMLSEKIVAYDNLSNKIFIIVYANPQTANAYDNAIQTIQDIKQQILSTPLSQHGSKIPSQDEIISQALADNGKEHYTAAVNKTIQYLIDGDAMQVVLSQRFKRAFNTDPLDFYRALRFVNPSPYMFYFNFGDFYVAGSSPEILVRLENDTITLRPLAGTRRRGSTVAEDLQLEQELLSDPKEIAEHLMLIDLGRNDVGRVSEIGSVAVTEQMVVERYSHVMHLSSNVVGKLKSNLSAMDILRATFPAGTVSGTPKIRAMEIIDELEKSKRGVYAGAIGYLSWNNTMDMAIALRTAVIKDKMLYIQAGAGIVVDSCAENEWEECVNKSKALNRAADIAERF